jgi:oligoendopeptidase F
LKSQPAFIHLNFSKKLRDVTTIAHEMGHAIHHKLIASTQPALYVDTSMAVAETASTFMEDFVIQAILEDADEELRLALQMEQLNDSVSSIQRQIACYRFEQALHNLFRETGYLSKEDIGELFQEHMKSYMGEYVEQSPGSQNWWLYWDHIRRHFYVYSYASGLLISKSLQNKVKENPEFIIEVKRILEMGTSRSPKDAFAEVDIDITDPAFWELGLKEQRDLLEDTWTLAEKLGKI